MLFVQSLAYKIFGEQNLMDIAEICFNFTNLIEKYNESGSISWSLVLFVWLCPYLSETQQRLASLIAFVFSQIIADKTPKNINKVFRLYSVPSSPLFDSVF